MELNLRKLAQENTLLARIMAGREKLETDEVCNKSLHINGVDFAPKFDAAGNRIVNEETGELDTFAVVTFSELPNNYYCAGVVLSNACKAWLEAAKGDLETVNKALAANPVEVVLRSGRTKKGQNLVNAIFP